MNEKTVKEEFSVFCKILYNRDLVCGVGGNVSVRFNDNIFITPSGYSLGAINPEVIVSVNMDGKVLEGGTPSMETGMHLGIFKTRAEVNTVCHVHGASLIAFSTLAAPGQDVLPPITPGFAYLAHPLAMLPFMVPGSETLSRAVKEIFSAPGCAALLLQNHGLVTVGKRFQEAINIAEEIDEAVRIWLFTGGKGSVIPDEAVARIKEL
ncbi:MAG: class II aldolase/adducin family protein [Deltaproteobacteria bacterium]|nr:class II aldolase/adducin family protein [Deltaproteobacteria bacterium]